MKSPEHPYHVPIFLAAASVAWLAMIHGLAFFIFGVSIQAAWVIVAGIAASLIGVVAYFLWEFRQAIMATSDEPAAPVQDVSLLMLSRSGHTPLPIQHRRTRSRLVGHHPATERIISLHRPPRLDRRMRKRAGEGELAMAPLLDYSKNRRVTPSAN